MNLKTRALRIKRVSDLADNVAELALYNRAIVSVLLQRGLITPEELKAEMCRIDEMDGKVDGKFTGNLACIIHPL